MFAPGCHDCKPGALMVLHLLKPPWWWLNRRHSFFEAVEKLILIEHLFDYFPIILMRRHF